MTKWSKNAQKWPRVGPEKTFKTSGKDRLRDWTWKLAQPWPENGPKTAKHFPENSHIFHNFSPLHPLRRFSLLFPTGSSPLRGPHGLTSATYSVFWRRRGDAGVRRDERRDPVGRQRPTVRPTDRPKVTRWSKNAQQWPTVGPEKMSKTSGKHRLRD